MPDKQQHSMLPAAIAKGLSDKLYEKQRGATLKIERMVRDALEADDEQKIYEIIAELTTDFATSEKETSRIGGLLGLAATAVALTPVNITPFLPQMVPPMVSAMSDGESKVRYFACESLYNVAKVSQGYILRWFNDIFDGLARVTADSVKSVKDGADYLDRLVKDIVAEQAATCLDWYEVTSDGVAPTATNTAATAASHTAENNTMADLVVETFDGGLKISGIADLNPMHGNSSSTSPPHNEFGAQNNARKGPRLAFSLEKFVPLLAERMHTYKPSTRLYLIEWIRVLDSVPGLDIIAYLPEFLDGLIRFLSDPNDDVRTKTQTLLGELLSEIRECVELQRFGGDIANSSLDLAELIPTQAGDLTSDDARAMMGEPASVDRGLSSARVRSSTLQSDVHVEGRFASETPKLSLSLRNTGAIINRHHPLSSQRSSRAPSITSSTPTRSNLASYPHHHNYYQTGYQQSQLSRQLHHHHHPGSSTSAIDGLALGRSSLHRQGAADRSTVSLVSSALMANSGQVNEMTDELRMAARKKRIRAERADSALIPGSSVVIDFARCITILIPHLESNDQEIQSIALCWVYEFTWLCPQVMVQYVPKLINAVLPSVSHPVTSLRHTAEDANMRLFDLVAEARAPVKERIRKPNLQLPSTPIGAVKKPYPSQTHLRTPDVAEFGARALKPLPPVTSTTTAVVSNVPRPKSPCFSAHSVASGAGQMPAARSRAESLLQASAISPVVSLAPSAVTTPAVHGGNDKQLGHKSQSQTVSPPTQPAANTTPQTQQTGGHDKSVTSTAASGIASPNTDAESSAKRGGQNGPNVATSAANIGASNQDISSAKVPKSAIVHDDAAAGEEEAFIREPFNYEHAATAIMELFAKNVHEPTKIAGMKWLLLLHRKAPWRILTPEDMSFPVLLKMLSDSSEQVVKLDLELFAQISLYSQENDEIIMMIDRRHYKNRPAFEVQPSSLPYLSRFLASLLQMFATDRALLETRAALMVRQLCVVLDPELVFCLFAKLLDMPRFGIAGFTDSIQKKDAPPPAPPTPHHRISPDLAIDQPTGEAIAETNVNAPGSNVEPTSTNLASDTEADIDDKDRANRSGNDSDSQGDESDVGGSDANDVGDDDDDADVEEDDDDADAEDEGDHEQAEEEVEVEEEEEEEEEIADLDFISVMVQHLSWILTAASEVATSGVTAAASDSTARIQTKNPGRGTDDDSAAQAVSTTEKSEGFVNRMRRAGGNSSGSSGRRRGASTNASAAEQQQPMQQKPTKLVRGSTSASAASKLRDQGTVSRSASTIPPRLGNVGPSSRTAVAAASSSGTRGKGSHLAGDSDKAGGGRQHRRSLRQNKQQQAVRAAKAQKARNVVSAAVSRVKHDIEQNMRSHGLFATLFKTWSHNPAACLTLCLLSQHYETGANLIAIFGQQTQDLTVSFLVQLDKLVQLIESPVFTYLRLQLLDPLQHPLLVRALYGLLMLLPQSSAFAILRNRLSTVAMVPFPGQFIQPYYRPQQQQQQFMTPAAQGYNTARFDEGPGQQRVPSNNQVPTINSAPPSQQQQHYHYHYHYHSYYPQRPGGYSTQGIHELQLSNSSTLNAGSSNTGAAAPIPSSTATAGTSSAANTNSSSIGGARKWGGPLFSAVGVSSQDLSELMRLLSVSSQRSAVPDRVEIAGSSAGPELTGGLAQQLQASADTKGSIASAGGIPAFPKLRSNEAPSVRGLPLTNPSAILHQLAELQRSQLPEAAGMPATPSGAATSPPQPPSSPSVVASNAAPAPASTAVSPQQQLSASVSGDSSYHHPTHAIPGMAFENAYGQQHSPYSSPQIAGGSYGGGWHPQEHLSAHEDTTAMTNSGASDTQRLLEGYKVVRRRHAVAVIRHQSR
ncbi:hypothetical protein GGI12_004081 [Dipsacomyces acuminosporus]|nr:hypothetical protein GGI12_004081 [Dipsacomyces acuminosporus]